VLFFVILQVFPLYLALFGRGFQAYAAFGVFLLLMFWVYLLGIVLVLGAELNAFLEEPARSTALAETKAKAEKGQVALQPEPGGVQTVASGSGSGADQAAPSGQAGRGRHPFGSRSAAEAATATPGPASARPAAGAARPGIGGRLIGLVGLFAAVFLLSRQPQAGEPRPQRS
jgi:hypothetical protein